jgi:hypothetical protein
MAVEVLLLETGGTDNLLLETADPADDLLLESSMEAAVIYALKHNAAPGTVYRLQPPA